jgi:hypothetical protein
VENLTCVAFPGYIGDYGWRKSPYGFFVKFQGEELYSVRNLAIYPFDATYHRFLIGNIDELNWGSKAEAIQVEEEFAAARAYCISLVKAHSGEPVERILTDGFSDMIEKLKSVVEKLAEEKYYYINRISPEPDKIDSRMSIEAKEEEIAYIRSRPVYSANAIEIPDTLESIVPVSYKMIHSSTVKRVKTKDNELLVSDDVERVQQVFHTNMEGAFIYLGDAHEIDSVIHLRAARNSIEATVPDGFTNTTKLLNKIFTDTSMLVSDDTEESMEAACIRVLFEAGFVFMYHTDDFGTRQLAKAKALAEEERTVELIYD